MEYMTSVRWTVTPADAEPGASPWAPWYQLMFAASPVAVALADEHGLLLLANDAYCELVGRPRQWLLGRSSREFTHPDDLAGHAAMEHLMGGAAAQLTALRVEKRYVRPDGEIRWAWVSVAWVPGPEGRKWTMAIVQDTTDRREAEDALLAEATTDALTGLRNRRGWLHDTQALLAGWDRAEPVTVAMIDLDHFKAFNDTSGHSAGDALLRRFGTALQTQLRTGDLVGRWGGEEFTVALPGSNRRAAAGVLAELAELVPDGQTFSAGYDLLRPDEDILTCLERVDQHLYRAKNLGRNQYLTAPAPGR
jgi:diguanylate cyclase (GGDEF)-like protein/PAS domain S-box-containing protein